MKKLLTVFVSLFLGLSTFIGSTCIVASAQTIESEPVLLYANDIQTIYEDDHVSFRINLYNDENSKAIEPVIAIVFSPYIYSDNMNGEITWTATLTKEPIKGVSGTIYIKRDWFGPFNPLLDTLIVSEYYSTGTLFNTANGVEYFSLGDSYKDSDNFIIQAQNFCIHGLAEDYYVIIGELQAELKDFGHKY